MNIKAQTHALSPSRYHYCPFLNASAPGKEHPQIILLILLCSNTSKVPSLSFLFSLILPLPSLIFPFPSLIFPFPSLVFQALLTTLKLQYHC